MEKRKVPAVGVRNGVGILAKGHKGHVPLMLTVAVRFDDETFAQIRAKAEKEGLSFAGMVRILVEIGLEESQ